MIYLAGIVITFFLAILLTGKKKKTPADRILVVWLCVIGIHLAMFYLFISGKIYDYPWLLGIHLPYPLLHGPFLFLYTSILTGQKSRIPWILHFVPAILLYIILIPYFRLPASEKINVYLHRGAGYEETIRISFIAIIISGVSYVTASMFLLRSYRKSIKNEFSNIEKINLAWLRYLIYGIAIIWITVMLEKDPFIYTAVVLFVFFLGYFGIRQTGIFVSGNSKTLVIQNEGDQDDTWLLPGPSTAPDMEDKVAGTPGKIKYEKSGLNEEKAEIIYKQLADVMEKQKLFTEPELTLAGLAKTLDVHPNHLSQVINSFEGKNFYDYVNLQRVEEFKKLAHLPANRSYPLPSLAYDCGFNSKTSFNRNFRKATGVSPSKYLQQEHISLK